MATQKQLFRKTALERLASPERLDQLIETTSPMGWLTLLVIVVLVLITIVWGILGNIPTTVDAAGILTRTGGIFTIQSPSDGIILSVNVSPGDVVKAGEVVARISQVDALNQIKQKKQELANLINDNTNSQSLAEIEMKNMAKFYDEGIKNIRSGIHDLNNRIVWLQEQLENRKNLLRRGLITKEKYIETQNELSSAHLELQEKRNEINNIINSKFNLSRKKETDFLGRKSQLEEAQLQLELMQIDLVLSTQVLSPYEGKITDVNFKDGNLVARGQPMFTLEKRGKDGNSLKAVLFVQPMEAKNIKVGMKVLINPIHVKQEEYGNMLGLVTFAGFYPATQRSMMKDLENESLVTNMSANSTPYKFEVTFIPDSNSPNGFKWTTLHGYPHAIISGTMCRAKIVVEQQRPINLVIPLFKRYLLGIGLDEDK